MPPRVEIGDLRIRVPGLSAQEARGFAGDIARRLSQALRAAPPRQLGQLHLRVTVPQGASRETLKSAVARAIVEALG